MNKKTLKFFIIILFIVLTTTAFGHIGVVINNDHIHFNSDSGYPFIDSNNRTLVPLRITMESAGFHVFWDGEYQTATVTDEKGTTVHIKIGDNYITKDLVNEGRIESFRIENDTFAQNLKGRTYLPMRVVLESFGVNVSWDGVSQSVIANTNKEDSLVLSAEEIYSKNSPAVFFIEMYDENGEVLRTGSGFFIDSKGTAITNYHVIENASSAYIFTTDEAGYLLEGVYDFDEELDIAKIKVKGKYFNIIDLDYLNSVSGGSLVYAIGSPKGLTNSISQGIISHPKRVINGIEYYQITAPISPGSSGGALFNKNGKVIGITSATYEDAQNINLAIPTKYLLGLKDNKLKTLSEILLKNEGILSLSRNNINLTLNGNTSVLISGDYFREISVEYKIKDTNIVDAYWEEWEENSINLNLTGLNVGSTEIIINLYDGIDDRILDTKTMKVNVRKVATE